MLKVHCKLFSCVKAMYRASERIANGQWDILPWINIDWIHNFTNLLQVFRYNWVFFNDTRVPITCSVSAMPIARSVGVETIPWSMGVVAFTFCGLMQTWARIMIINNSFWKSSATWNVFKILNYWSWFNFLNTNNFRNRICWRRRNCLWILFEILFRHFLSI